MIIYFIINTQSNIIILHILKVKLLTQALSLKSYFLISGSLVTLSLV